MSFNTSIIIWELKNTARTQYRQATLKLFIGRKLDIEACWVFLEPLKVCCFFNNLKSTFKNVEKNISEKQKTIFYVLRVRNRKIDRSKRKLTITTCHKTSSVVKDSSVDFNRLINYSPSLFGAPLFMSVGWVIIFPRPLSGHLRQSFFLDVFLSFQNVSSLLSW